MAVNLLAMVPGRNHTGNLSSISDMWWWFSYMPPLQTYIENSEVKHNVATEVRRGQSLKVLEVDL
jgi:hypothetical protein